MSLSAQEKLIILQKVLKEGSPVSSVCRQNKISRKTFYAWKAKYEVAKTRAKSTCLESRRLKGLQHPRGTKNRFKTDILSLAVTHPEWGSHRISKILKVKSINLGNHGVYTLLKELKLETQEKREEFASLYRSPLRLLPEARKRLVEGVVLARRKTKVIADEFKVSRKTLWKWKKRYQEAQKAEIQLVLALKDQNPIGSAHPRGTPTWLEKEILDVVISRPEYSTHSLSWVLRGKIGNHGIQNVLLRNGLNTFDRRLEYSRFHAPKPVLAPVAGFLGRLKSVWQTFVPQVAPAPPPKLVSPFRRAGLPFVVSLLSTTIFSTLFVFWLSIFAGQSPGVQIGLFFATIALLVGSFFFLYSMKYYFTLALVLSFSTQSSEGREQTTNNKENGHGWLGRIFGLNGSWRGLTSSGSSTEVRPPSASGLQANLDHIKLERYPFISIHLPFYNESKVANRILAACTSFDYPASPQGGPNYEVIVCDDSTDETTQIVKEWEKHPQVKVLHRPTREGFKGGALKYALQAMDPRTEFVIVFDADFVPYPDTLTQFMKYFKATGGWREDLSYQGTSIVTMPYKTNEKVEISPQEQSAISNQQSAILAKNPIAVVAGYQWHVLNKSENWITRGVRTEYAGSYVIERPGQEILGAMKIIHGSVYCARADVLKHFGWGTSITEDYELTLRIYEKGFKVVYTPYIQAPSECVSTIKRLIRQRMRWAEGHSFNTRKMFWKLLFGRWEVRNEKLDTEVGSEKENQNPNISLQNPASHLQPHTSKHWVPSPLTLTEKLEFLYLAPYYLQAFLFLLGTFSWLISETVFAARLPFWTSLWGWSLVLTNFFALPLMNAVGLFLEESEEKDYLGLFSFLALCYIVTPFQAYAAVKGFIEPQEGPWFRTPKTGKITDIFTRGRFYRWLAGIFPFRPATGGVANLKLAELESQPNPYFALATSNNQFNGFGIKPKKARWLGKLSVVLVLVVSLLVGNLVPLASLGQASIESKTISTKTEGEAPLARGLTLRPEKPDFGPGEQPKFTLNIDQKEAKKNLFGFGPKQVEAAESEVKTSLYYSGSGGDLVDVPSQVEKKEDGNFDITLLTEDFIKPGRYTLRTTVFNEGALYQGSQDFSWGVLAINTNKSIYTPGETAELAFGVLDDAGNTLCQANLELKIYTPEGKYSYLSVNDGGIKNSEKCQGNNYSPVPDYTAHFKVENTGIYKLTLAAQTEAGIRTAEDQLEVVESVPFDIERTFFPTRIKTGVEYPVKLTVIANQDFQGEVVETAPQSFEIAERRAFSVERLEDEKIQKLIWEVDWKKGETHELGYTIKFPPESPQFYLVGPISVDSVFGEARQWQIAADSPGATFMESGTDATQGFEFWTPITGSVTSDTAQAKTGPRSIKFASSAGGGQAYIRRSSILADSGRRISLYLRLTDMPTADLVFVGLLTSSNSQIVRLRVSSVGILGLYKADGTQLGSNGTATLTTGIWYRIGLAYTITSTTVNQFRVFVNGAQDISVSNATFVSVGTSNLDIGWISTAGNSKVIHIDDVYTDDSATLTDTGDIRVTYKAPAAVNNNNFDTTGGTGAVNERPLGTTNYKQHAASTQVQQDYTLQTASQGDLDISGMTLVARSAWVYAKKGSPVITVTSLGTNQNKASADPWTAFSSITLASGDSIIVGLSSDYPTWAQYWPNVAWNGISLSRDIERTYVTDVAVAIYSRHNVTGATGDVVVDWNDSYVPVAMVATLYKASGIATSSMLDKSSTGAGSGTDASTGSTGTLSQADELAIAITGVEDEIDDAHGTWTTGSGYVSGNEQFNATNGGGDTSNVQVHSVAMVVSATDALQGVDAGHDSSDWAAVIATFKADMSSGTPGIVDNGSVTAITLTTSDALYTVITDSTSYPSNAAGIGMRSSNVAADTYFYEGGTLIAYKPAFTQSAYRWYANTDTATAGDPLAANNTSYTLTSAGQAFRMRALIHVAGVSLNQNDGSSFRLEFAEMSGTCDTAFSGESYTEVTTTSLIKYNNNSPADEAATSAKSAADEPDHSSHTRVIQSYQELNPFTTDEAAIPAGQDGLWDFALADNTGGDNKTYCFRIRLADGSTLDTVSVVPEITTVPENGWLLFSLIPVLWFCLKRMKKRQVVLIINKS